jgi:hypothetical protein
MCASLLSDKPVMEKIMFLHAPLTTKKSSRSSPPISSNLNLNKYGILFPGSCRKRTETGNASEPMINRRGERIRWNDPETNRARVAHPYILITDLDGSHDAYQVCN